MDKITKLQDLLKLLQNDTITPSQVKQFLEMVLGVIKKSKDEFANLSQENLQKISDYIALIEENNQKWGITQDTKTNAMVEQMEGKISECKALIAKVKTIKPIDGINGVNPDPEDVVPLVLAKLPKVEPFELKRLEVVKEINLGKKNDLKIERKQIEGLDKLEKDIESRALSILDQRTQYLINKTVKHDTTLSGSGTDSDPLSATNSSGSGYLPLAGGTMTGAEIAADHEATGAVAQVVNVVYGTSTPPTASTTPIGTLFIRYIP